SDAFRSGLIHFIERDKSVFVPLGRDACLIENSRQDLPIIYANCEVIKSERDQRIARRGNQLRFNQHRTRAEHVNITLIELAKAATRGTIGAPGGLNLIA